MIKFILQRDQKYKPKHKNMKMFAVLQISFLAQGQKACWHIPPLHRACCGTVGKKRTKKKINEVGKKQNQRKGQLSNLALKPRFSRLDCLMNFLLWFWIRVPLGSWTFLINQFFVLVNCMSNHFRELQQV